MTQQEPMFKITYYESSDNDQSDFQSIEKQFADIDEGIAWILDHETDGTGSEVYHNEPNRADILLMTKYLDENGNERSEYDDNLYSINYMAEIELIENNNGEGSD